MEKAEWNPGFYGKNNEFIQYEKRWYCNENKVIHGSQKEFLNCNKCNPKNINVLK